MTRSLRLFSMLAICCLAFVCSACASNNEGKIDGKWKNSAPFEGLPPGEVTLEFTSGKLTMSAMGITVLTANYRLSSGDNIMLSDVNLKVETADKKKRGGRIKVTIRGDNMTWVEADSTMQMERVK